MADLDNLSEKELDDKLNPAIEVGLKEETEQTSKPPEKDTAATTPAKETEAKEATGTTGTESPDKKDTQEAPLLAGKYKTPADLEQGFREIHKALGREDAPMTKYIEAAKKHNDWSLVEDRYKELQAEYTRKQAEEKAKTTEAVASAPDKETAPGSPEEAKAIQAKINEITYQEMLDSPLLKDMERLGIAMPKNDEEFQQLTLEYPFYAREFKDLLTKTYNEVAAEAREVLKSRQGAPTANNAAKESAKTTLTQFSTEHKLGLTEDQIKTIIDEAEKSESIFEDKHGINYIRDKGIEEYFFAKKLPELLKTVKLNGEQDGRAQVLKDLEEGKKKAVNSISTANLPGKSREKPKVDFTDPNQLKAAGEDQIDNRTKEILKDIYEE